MMRPELLPGAFFPSRCAIIKGVMRMKKTTKKALIVASIVLLVLVLLISVLFFWKGGHHAISVSNELGDWLNADAADLCLTVQYQNGSFSIDSTTGQIKPGVEQWHFTTDAFWSEYEDEKVYGLTAEGITAYLHRGILYTDTGRAYTLPDLSGLKPTIDRLRLGLLIYGRMTKNGDTYNLSMKTDELDLSASVTIDKTVQMLTVMANFSDGRTIRVTLSVKDIQDHPLPQPVLDAMVLARMEPPVSLSEPLDALMPAMEQLLPLSGKLKLEVSSGILKLSDTMDLTVAGRELTLSDKGKQIDLTLPQDFSDFPPAALGLLALRNGTFSIEDAAATVTIDLPGEAVTVLVESLVPQTADLGVTFKSGKLVLNIAGGRLTGASVSAKGSVPFLFSTIPLNFSAMLTVT